MRKSLAVLLVTLLVGAIVFGAGCSGKQAEAPKTPGDSRYGGTLVIGLGADATGLDPQRVMNNESGFVMGLIFDRLVHYKPGTTEVIPGLAEKWDISPDGLVYTFNLKKGVKFTDGTPFNAGAMVKEFDRMKNPANPNYYKKLQGVHSFGDDTYDPVTKYEAVDDYTFKVTLKAPYAPFLANLGMVWSGVMSPAAVEKSGLDSPKNPVGTGPFKLVEWVRDDHITLEANKDYWGGKPFLDKVTFKIIPENSVRLMKLEKGELDVIDGINPDDVPKIKNNPKLALLEQPGLTINGVRLPTDFKPFDDKRVRQALNYAVNKEEMDNFLYKGVAVEMKSPLPPVQWGYNNELKGYPYDPEKAKKLLAEAGYPNGFKAKLLSYPNPRGYNPVGPKLAVAIQDYLKKVGVEVQIEQLEWGAFLQTIRSGKYEGMGLGGWSGDNGDPDNFLFTLFHSKNIPVGNTAKYKNEKVDDLLLKAQQANSMDERVRLYKEAQALIMDDAPWIFVNHTKQVRATSAKVKGLQLNPLQMFLDMEKVYIEK